MMSDKMTPEEIWQRIKFRQDYDLRLVIEYKNQLNQFSAEAKRENAHRWQNFINDKSKVLLYAPTNIHGVTLIKEMADELNVPLKRVSGGWLFDTTLVQIKTLPDAHWITKDKTDSSVHYMFFDEAFDKEKINPNDVDFDKLFIFEYQ